jgi:hypothetical protein
MTATIVATDTTVKRPTAVAAVDSNSQPGYTRAVGTTLADRLRMILDHKGWSARRLGREAGIAQTHPAAVIAKFDADPDASVETSTVEAMARAAGVSRDWLLTGRGEPGWSDDPPTDAPAPADEGAPGPDVPDAVSQPPATYGAIPGYDALERAARRIAKDCDDWVWRELRASNPLRNSRVPLTPASLAAIAKVFAEHGVPPADAATNGRRRT